MHQQEVDVRLGKEHGRLDQTVYLLNELDEGRRRQPLRKLRSGLCESCIEVRFRCHASVAIGLIGGAIDRQSCRAFSAAAVLLAAVTVTRSIDQWWPTKSKCLIIQHSDDRASAAPPAFAPPAGDLRLGAKRIFGRIGTSHKGREAEIVEPANKATSQPKAANPLDKRVAIATEISACLGEYPRAG